METEIAKTWILVFILAKNISERVFFPKRNKESFQNEEKMNRHNKNPKDLDSRPH